MVIFVDVTTDYETLYCPQYRLPCDAVPGFAPTVNFRLGAGESSPGLAGARLLNGRWFENSNIEPLAVVGICARNILEFSLCAIDHDSGHLRMIEANQQRIRQLENELSENTERFRALLSLTHQNFACIEFDHPIETSADAADQASSMLGGQLIDCNDSFAQAYGATSANDIVGSPFATLILSPQEKFLDRARRFISMGYKLIDELVEIERNGDSQSLLTSAIGELSAEGLVRLWIVSRDVTLRRLVEHAIADGAEALDEATESLDYAFWLIDWKELAVLYVGSAYEKLWHQSKQDLIDDPMHWLDVVHPSDRMRVKHAFFAHAANGTYDETYRIVIPDGKVRLIRDRAFPITKSDGEVDRVVGIAVDVTRAKEKIAGLNHFFDTAREMLAVVAADGSFREINPAFCRLTGYDAGELSGKMVLDFIHEEDQQSSIEWVDKLDTGAATVDFDNRFRYEDGAYRRLRWNISPVCETGVLYAIVEECAAATDDSFGGRESAEQRLSVLTPREREIMQLVVDGKANKAIARALGISQRTVEKHRSHVMRKLGIDNVPDLVKLALIGEAV